MRCKIRTLQEDACAKSHSRTRHDRLLFQAVSAPEKQRFLDKEEELAVRLVMEELHPFDPLRAAFNHGADVLRLIMIATNTTIRHRLRDLRVAALNRQMASGEPPEQQPG